MKERCFVILRWIIIVGTLSLLFYRAAFGDDGRAPAELCAATARIVHTQGNSIGYTSGVLCHADNQHGFVLTCAHGFEGGLGDVVVEFSFPRHELRRGTVLVSDIERDIAIVRIDRVSRDPIAILDGSVSIGEAASVLGYPHGQRSLDAWRPRITPGRDGIVIGPWLATSAEFPSGMSGGPLFVRRAGAWRVAGICSTKYTFANTDSCRWAIDRAIRGSNTQFVCRDGQCTHQSMMSSMASQLSPRSDPLANQRRKPTAPGNWQWIQLCPTRPYPHWHSEPPRSSVASAPISPQVASPAVVMPPYIDLSPVASKLDELRSDLQQISPAPITTKLDELRSDLRQHVGQALLLIGNQTATGSGGGTSISIGDRLGSLGTIGTLAVGAGAALATGGVGGLGIWLARRIARRAVQRAAARISERTDRPVAAAARSAAAVPTRRGEFDHEYFVEPPPTVEGARSAGTGRPPEPMPEGYGPLPYGVPPSRSDAERVWDAISSFARTNGMPWVLSGVRNHFASPRRVST